MTRLCAEIEDAPGADVPENFSKSQLYFFKIRPPFRIFVPAVSYQHAQLSRRVKAQPKRQRGKRKQGLMGFFILFAPLSSIFYRHSKSSYLDLPLWCALKVQVRSEVTHPSGKLHSVQLLCGIVDRVELKTVPQNPTDPGLDLCNTFLLI